MILTIEQRKLRWLKLYRSSGPFFTYLIHVPHHLVMPQLWPDLRQERLDWAIRQYEWQDKTARWLDDDQIPYLSVTSGTEIFAEAIGCDVYRPHDNMPFAIPKVSSAAQASKLHIPEASDTHLMDLLEMARWLRTKAGSGIPLKLPDIQSPMDILAQVWDKTDLFTALIDEPECVLDLASKIRRLLVQFLDLWFAEFGTSYVAHHPDYYMEGGITLSADEIGNISPDMFNTFFLGELNELSDHFGGIGIHCCAQAKHQWQGLKSVRNVRLINLARPMDTLKEAYRVFPETAHFPYLLVDGVSRPMPDLYPDDFPPMSRVVITQYAADEEDARRKAEKLNSMCRI